MAAQLITNFRKTVSHNFYTHLIVCPTNLSFFLVSVSGNGLSQRDQNSIIERKQACLVTHVGGTSESRSRSHAKLGT